MRRNTWTTTMMLATSSAFVVPAARVVHRSDRFFGSSSDDEDELAKLRRENAELRSKLRKEEGGPLDFFKGLFGKRDETALDRQKKEMDTQIDKFFEGSGLLGGIVGSMTKGVVGMASSMMKETAADVDRVQRKVAAELERQGKGPITESDAPTQQSYSSTNINGRVTKNVQLVYRVTAANISAIVRVQAQIQENGDIDIIDLDLNDRPGNSTPRGSGFRSGTVIDV